MKIIITLLFIIIIFLIIFLKQEKVNPPESNNQNKLLTFEENFVEQSNKDFFNDEEPLISMCAGVKNEIQANIFYLKLNFEQLKLMIQPAIWRNEEFCVYRMNPISSIYNNKQVMTEEELYYPLGDVILFKNYNIFFNKAKSPNMFCNMKPEEMNNNNTLMAPAVENFVGNNNISNNNLRSLFKDNTFDNYRQPGIKGLKLFFKNGKKPVSFQLQAIIKGKNNENLYVWEPIPPEGYISLGHYCTLGKNPPEADTCNIRCLPKSCGAELSINPIDIIQSSGIDKPYGIYVVSNGKYFKGLTILEGQDYPTMKSHTIASECMNIETIKEEPVLNGISTIILIYENKNPATLNQEFNGFDNLMKTKFETFLISTPQFRLNNSRNIKEDDEDNELDNKRFKIIGGNLNSANNRATITLNLRGYSEDYEEISNENLKTELGKFINKHKINLGDNQKYWEMLLVNISGYNMRSFDIEVPIEYKDPRLLKDTETARKLLRGRFEDDFIEPTNKTRYSRNDEDTKATMSGFIKLSSLSN